MPFARMIRNKKWPWRLRLLAIMSVIVLVLSVVITVAGGRVEWIPSWDTLFALSGFQESPVSPDELRVTVLDVGEADCILLQSDETAVLIDAGESSRGTEILTALHNRGVKRLELVIATHVDADHIGAMDDVAREWEIGTLVMPFIEPSQTPETHVYTDMMTALKEKQVPISYAAFGAAYMIGNAKLTVLSGRRDWQYVNDNERSLVCRVTFGEHAMLFMGDAGHLAEMHLLNDAVPLTADVIKVGHHGSDGSSGPQFMAAVDPEIAVITCGFDNVHGHPHEDTLKVLQDVGAAVYRSDLHGDIVITSDGKRLSVASEKGTDPQADLRSE